MKIIEKLISFFSKEKYKTAPLLIIRKDAEKENIKEYNTIEEAISELEDDLSVSKDKIVKIKSSLHNLRFKSIVKIKDGEIVQ